MLVQMNRISLTLLAGAVLTLAGCSDAGNSSFVYGPTTLALFREAQYGTRDAPGVRDLLDERFGDPQQLRAWSKLPIDAGGIFGSVAVTPGDSGPVTKLQLEFEQPLNAFSDSEESRYLQFVTGEAAKADSGPLRAILIGWDSRDGTAHLQSKLEIIPAAGDRVIVDGGIRLQRGRVLYQRHCSHCHGTSGDGAGPTAEYLFPRPRDYRRGIFKFTLAQAQMKASRSDLKRILRNGIPGTYMPSFVPMLDEDELDDIVEYIRFLAMRGEFEFLLGGELAADFSSKVMRNRMSRKGDEEGEKKEDIVAEFTEGIGDAVEFVGDRIADEWTQADTEEAMIVPSVPRIPDSLQSRRLGRELFVGKSFGCSDCHGISGRGDGPQTTIFEKIPRTDVYFEEPGLHDEWGNVNQPRDLTRGIYRGGRRPIDLFARIHGGIKGTRMPSFGKEGHENIWHLVNYVLSIPFENEPGRSAAVESK